MNIEENDRRMVNVPFLSISMCTPRVPQKVVYPEPNPANEMPNSSLSQWSRCQLTYNQHGSWIILLLSLSLRMIADFSPWSRFSSPIFTQFAFLWTSNLCLLNVAGTMGLHAGTSASGKSNRWGLGYLPMFENSAVTIWTTALTCTCAHVHLDKPIFEWNYLHLAAELGAKRGGSWESEVKTELREDSNQVWRWKPYKRYKNALVCARIETRHFTKKHNAHTWIFERTQQIVRLQDFCP